MNRNNDKYLAHYGILGMKWGVRRYQNPDGTLTSAGKKRTKKIQSSRKEGIDYAKKLAADRKKGISAANALISAQKKAKETGIVDSDFLNNPNISQKAKNKVTRLAEQSTKKEEKESATLKKQEKKRRKELVRNRSILSNKELDDLSNRINRENQLLKSSKSEGKDFTEQVISTSGNRILTTVLTGAGIYAVRAALQKNFDPKEAAEYLKPKKK